MHKIANQWKPFFHSCPYLLYYVWVGRMKMKDGEGRETNPFDYKEKWMEKRKRNNLQGRTNSN